MIMLSPRLRSPKGGGGVVSPRGGGSQHHLSNTDLIYVGFLRHVKWLLIIIAGIAMLRLMTLPSPSPLASSSSRTPSNNRNANDGIMIMPTTRYVNNNINSVPSSISTSSLSYDDHEDDDDSVTSSSEAAEADAPVIQTTTTMNATPRQQQLRSNASRSKGSKDHHEEDDNDDGDDVDEEPSKEDNDDDNDDDVQQQSDEESNDVMSTATKSSSSSFLFEMTPKNTTTSTTMKDILEWYKASNAPVIPYSQQQANDKTFIQVHLIVDITSTSSESSSGTTATDSNVSINPASKFLLDGIERSHYLQVVAITFIRSSSATKPLGTWKIHPRQATTPLVYIIDWGSMNRDCHRLQLVMESIQSMMDTSTTKTIHDDNGIEEEDNDNDDNDDNDDDDSNETSLSSQYMLFIDSSGSTRQTICDFLVQRNNDDKKDKTTTTIRLAKRSIVENRYYDHSNNTIHPGNIVPLSSSHQHDDRGGGDDAVVLPPTLHSPIVLRESFVMSINNVSMGQPVEDLERPYDVGYFWNAGDYAHYSFYRRDIARVIKKLHHSKITSSRNVGSKKNKFVTMENQVGLAYTDKRGMAAGNVQYEYAYELLSCKIVVITQRDEFEDHYRLMESLASGALVMTDPMIAPPAGLVDKVNIVYYDSPKSLKELIRYYLQPENTKEREQIALEGYKLAMGRHRSWHRLEDLLFGRPLTHVDQPYQPGPEKEKRPKSIYWVSDEKASLPFL